MTRHLIDLAPFLSPPLTLNDRDHWRVKARKTRDLRMLVGLRARSLGIGPYQRVAVGLRWQPRDRRRRDEDNPFPTIKAATDGLVDAGVVADDDSTHVRHDGVEILTPEPGQKRGRLWLTVTTLDGAP